MNFRGQAANISGEMPSKSLEISEIYKTTLRRRWPQISVFYSGTNLAKGISIEFDYREFLK